MPKLKAFIDSHIIRLLKIHLYVDGIFGKIISVAVKKASIDSISYDSQRHILKTQK
jgi:hypothetical protein